MELLLTLLVAVVAEPEPNGPPAVSWAEAARAMKACGDVDEDVELAVMAEDPEELRQIIDQWFSAKRHLLVHDRDVLKRALKAFRKSLKVTTLDAESSLGGGPMSSGRESAIVAITPPERYGRPVWDELVRQGRLLDARKGMYELPPS